MIDKRVLAEAKRQMRLNGSLRRHEPASLEGKTLDELFDEYNDEYFQGKLPKIPCSFVAGMRKSAIGLYFWHGTKMGKRKIKNGRGLRIELCSRRVTEPSKIRGVLLHEMCHHYVMERCGSHGHGPEWRRAMQRCGFRGKINRCTG